MGRHLIGSFRKATGAVSRTESCGPSVVLKCHGDIHAFCAASLQHPRSRRREGAGRRAQVRGSASGPGVHALQRGRQTLAWCTKHRGASAETLVSPGWTLRWRETSVGVVPAVSATAEKRNRGGARTLQMGTLRAVAGAGIQGCVLSVGLRVMHIPHNDDGVVHQRASDMDRQFTGGRSEMGGGGKMGGERPHRWVYIDEAPPGILSD